MTSISVGADTGSPTYVGAMSAAVRLVDHHVLHGLSPDPWLLSLHVSHASRHVGVSGGMTFPLVCRETCETLFCVFSPDRSGGSD